MFIIFIVPTVIVSGVIIFLTFRKNKKSGVIVTASVSALIIISGVFFIREYLLKPPIGIISGAECDSVTIDGVRYEEYANDFSSADRDRYLGIAETTDHEIKFRIYTVKNSDEYIYRLWGWDGAFLKRVN